MTDEELQQVEDPGDTAAAKIMRTLRDVSEPEEDAEGLELTLASVAMAMERGLGPELDRNQASGKLDEFLLALARWIAAHRSDNADALVVVELPQRTLKLHDLPHGIGLQRLNEAINAAGDVSSPL